MITSLLFRALVLSALTVATACADPSGWREVARFSGTGAQTTKPLRLVDPWRARWQCAPMQPDSGLIFAVTAERRGEGMVQLLANQSSPGAATTYGTQAGLLYFDVNAANARWSLIIEQGPAPASVGAAAADPFGIRTWTALDGRTLEAEYLSATATHVRFRRASDGEVFDYELARLSAADRAWVAARRGK